MPDGSAACTPSASRRASTPASRRRPSAASSSAEPGSTIAKSRSPRIPGGGAGALPGPDVDADVVVVAPRGEEQGTRIAAHGDVEPQHTGIELLRGGEVRDLQVDVSDPRPGGSMGRLALALLGEQGVEVERQRRHLDLSVDATPFLARAVAVYLDPVALRVGEVEGLADEVVGGSGERATSVDDAAQGAGEVRPARHQIARWKRPVVPRRRGGASGSPISSTTTVPSAPRRSVEPSSSPWSSWRTRRPIARS